MRGWTAKKNSTAMGSAYHVYFAPSGQRFTSRVQAARHSMPPSCHSCRHPVLPSPPSAHALVTPRRRSPVLLAGRAPPRPPYWQARHAPRRRRCAAARASAGRRPLPLARGGGGGGGGGGPRRVEPRGLPRTRVPGGGASVGAAAAAKPRAAREAGAGGGGRVVPPPQGGEASVAEIRRDSARFGEISRRRGGGEKPPSLEAESVSLSAQPALERARARLHSAVFSRIPLSSHPATSRGALNTLHGPALPPGARESIMNHSR